MMKATHIVFGSVFSLWAALRFFGQAATAGDRASMTKLGNFYEPV